MKRCATWMALIFLAAGTGAAEDIDLTTFNDPVLRHDGTKAPPLKQRPLKGRIGFQELSRDGAHAMIRNARIKEIAAEKK